MNIENVIATTADLISESDKILFITGAGISADSGLPTHRIEMKAAEAMVIGQSAF